jgi:hypothetical protein
MNDSHEMRRPTDHLPPADERDSDDDRTTAGTPYPVTGASDDAGEISPATAAEPDKPARHGVDKLPPGIG